MATLFLTCQESKNCLVDASFRKSIIGCYDAYLYTYVFSLVLSVNVVICWVNGSLGCVSGLNMPKVAFRYGHSEFVGGVL